MLNNNKLNIFGKRWNLDPLKYALGWGGLWVVNGVAIDQTVQYFVRRHCISVLLFVHTILRST